MRELLVVGGPDVEALLHGRERDVLDAVAEAYRLHAERRTAVPHSLFLRFPSDGARRIIALPAYLGADEEVAGIKWIASFPENTRRGLERASAVIVLNSMETGQPRVVLEGSRISAERTAASAALAVERLRPGGRPTEAGVIGCGVISFHVVRYLRALGLPLERIGVFDLDAARAAEFARRCERSFDGLAVEVAGDAETLLRGRELVAIATTAGRPHIADLGPSRSGALILHVSLRDLAPEAILACDNVVDDPDHVCRAETSLHLAERLTGNRDFIRCTLGEVLVGAAPARADERVTVFSPFGLGALDLAVARMVAAAAAEEGRATTVPEFLPHPWA